MGKKKRRRRKRRRRRDEARSRAGRHDEGLPAHGIASAASHPSERPESPEADDANQSASSAARAESAPAPTSAAPPPGGPDGTEITAPSDAAVEPDAPETAEQGHTSDPGHDAAVEPDAPETAEQGHTSDPGHDTTTEGDAAPDSAIRAEPGSDPVSTSEAASALEPTTGADRGTATETDSSRPEATLAPNSGPRSAPNSAPAVVADSAADTDPADETGPEHLAEPAPRHTDFAADADPADETGPEHLAEPAPRSEDTSDIAPLIAVPLTTSADPASDKHSRRLARRAARERKRRERIPPRPWAFAKGVTVGALLVIPAIAVALVALSRGGIGAPGLELSRAIRFTALFAGVPAVLTTGGVGRLAARAALAPRRGLRTVARATTRAMAVAGAGLALLAAVPLGNLPNQLLAWLWVAAAGALVSTPPALALAAWAGRPPANR